MTDNSKSPETLLNKPSNRLIHDCKIYHKQSNKHYLVFEVAENHAVLLELADPTLKSVPLAQLLEDLNTGVSDYWHYSINNVVAPGMEPRLVQPSSELEKVHNEVAPAPIGSQIQMNLR